MSPQKGQPQQQAVAIPTALGSVDADRAKVIELVKALEAERGNRVLIYWASMVARISESVVVPFYDQLRPKGKQKRVDVVLFTMGGDAEAPWPIVSMLREYCDELGVIVPHRAHSAGTLMALGADEIVMTPLGTLGPIDPTRTHHLLPKRKDADISEPISVQDMRHAMEFVRTAFGPTTTYTPEAMATILTELFDKVHPLAIGAIEQTYALAKLIAKQCLATHMDPATEGAKIDEITNQLCDAYKSHSYEINRKEARAIGLKATDASPTLETILVEVLKFYGSRPVFPTPLPPKHGVFSAAIAWLESADLQYRVEAQYQVGDDGQPKYLGDRWTPY